MINGQALVSVIIPSYNHEKFVCDSIQSVKAIRDKVNIISVEMYSLVMALLSIK